MSLYPITNGLIPQASDVQQVIDVLNGKHDVGTMNFAGALAAPSTSGISLTVASGSALGVGSYNYKFTLITGYYKTDGATFNKTGETLASGSLSVSTTSGNQAVNITFPTTGFPSSAYQIGIYRTTAGGSSYGLVGTVKIGNSTFNDTVADGSLGSAPPTSNNTGTIFTVPAQPVFSCTPPNTFTSISANVETTIPYTGSNFDSNGVFTTPATGRWLFCPQFYCNITNGLVSMNYYKNGTNLYMLGRYQNPTTTTCEFIFSPSIVVALNQGDTVKFTATATASNNVGWQNCVVSVIKVA